MTFLFTDIEGSTKLYHELGDGYLAVLEEHHRRMRAAIAGHGGVEVKTEGDAFFVAFADAADGIAACFDAQTSLAVAAGWPHAKPVKVRMGLHTGPVSIVEDDYVGLSVHEAARVAGAAHGGQVLVSEDTAGLASGRLPPDVALRDLGRHALKDFPEPRHLFQLTHPSLPLAFPPLRTLTARGHNLPTAPASFVGRAEESAAVHKLVLGEHRLVTLIGSGGIGKSRLAIESGWSLLSWFPEGVWFVGLAAISGPAGVVPAMCDALGVLDAPGISQDDALRQRLSAGPVLLIVDNLEHVLDAAVILADLLAACPPLKILATSRERLRLRGEHLIAVEPLAGTDATTLFVDRAQANQPSFSVDDNSRDTVARICERLDGVPLALELAAARLFDMDLATLASRLDAALDLLTEGERDLPTRQQTLRTTVAWSYDLLKPAAQHLLRAMSVFAGGATEAAVSAVVDGPIPLQVLVDASLLRQSDPARTGAARWWMLETVRQFAAEQLVEEGEEDATVGAHAEWALALAADAAPQLIGPDQAAWMDVLEQDRLNLNLAVERADEKTRVAIAARLIRFWSTRGHWTEGRRLLDLALAGTGDEADRAEALMGAGHLAMRQFDFETARTLLAHGAGLAERLGLESLAAHCYNQLGEVAAMSGDQEGAVAIKERALDLARRSGDDRTVAIILADLGWRLLSADEYDRALTSFTGAMGIYRDSGDTGLHVRTLLGAVNCHIGLEHYDTALTSICEAEDINEDLADRQVEMQTLIGRGNIALRTGEVGVGRDRLREAFDVAEELGDLNGTIQALRPLTATPHPDESTIDLVTRAATMASRAGREDVAAGLREFVAEARAVRP